MKGLAESSTQLVVAEIDSLEGLEQVQPEWTDLFEASDAPTPFSSPQWLIAWWRHLGNGSLCVREVRHEGTLIAMAPLFVQSLPAAEEPQMLLMGTRISDYLDMLVAPGFEEEAWQAIFFHLQQSRERWAICDWQQLQGQSFCNRVLTPPGWISVTTVQEVCPVLPLPADSAELPRMVPRSMLEKLAYYRRHLRNLGSARIETANAETFDEAFGALVDLQKSQRASPGQAGAQWNEQLRAFHREVARALLDEGCLRLYSLRHDHRIIASAYCYHRGSRVFYYLGVSDSSAAHLSPGTLLIGHAIEQAIKEGATEFDFLRGRETYKYLWGAKGRLNYRRKFRHSCLPASRGAFPGGKSATLAHS